MKFYYIELDLICFSFNFIIVKTILYKKQYPSTKKHSKNL